MFAPIHLFVVVWQTWISPLMPDGPENFNTNMSALTWSWIQAWLVCPSHHVALVVVFVSATAHFILCITHSKPLFLSLFVLFAPIWGSGMEISVPIWVCDGENICAICTICIIWVVLCDLCRKCLHVCNISVSPHIWAPLNLFSGLTNLYWKRWWFLMLESIRSWDSGSGSRFCPERLISCQVAKGFQEWS